MMNICFLCRSFTNRGGTENYFYYLAKSLASQGHHIHLVGASTETQWEFGPEKENISLHSLDFKSMQFSGSWRLERLLPLYTLQYARAVAKFLPQLVEKHKIDIIEVPDWGGDAYFYLPQRKVPVCVHLLGYPGFKEQFNEDSLKRSFKERWFWQILRKQLLQADLVTSVSNAYTEFASRLFNLAQKPIKVLPIGIDTRLFHPNVDMPKEKIVFFAGRLEKSKGIEVLEEAIPSIIHKFSHIKFYFAGRDMPYKESSKTWSAHLTERFGNEKIRYLGVLSTKEMVTYFQKSLVCVMPSLNEPGGMVVLEAMACGCPVIGSAVGGLQESISHEQTGLLVAPNNALALADSVYRMLSQEDLREKLSKNALKHIDQNFNINSVSQQTVALYQKTMETFKL